VAAEAGSAPTWPAGGWQWCPPRQAADFLNAPAAWGVNFRVGTLSRDREFGRGEAKVGRLEMPSRHLAALPTCKKQLKKRQRREVGASASVNSWGRFFADEQSPLQAYRDCRTNDLSVGADGKDKPQPSALAERRRYLANYVNWLRPWSSSSRRWRGPGSSLFQTKAQLQDELPTCET